eukprot:CAMPEP_0115742612 /NCGR_PEP_ID=MMETSP0272-20121206/90622_1 /TAXON_ID=71861 /ORGANISM="Scrippsiella trochoidea, Strain CCMP3099" /LENGTH=101 /DNA_ID=CAMNT_0003187349 /DNA_START=381 /DNA_END=687 /DNA_ORIENTATION=-
MPGLELGSWLQAEELGGVSGKPLTILEKLYGIVAGDADKKEADSGKPQTILEKLQACIEGNARQAEVRIEVRQAIHGVEACGKIWQGAHGARVSVNSKQAA